MKNNNRIVLGKFTWDRTTHYLRPASLEDDALEQETVKLTNKQKALLECLVDAHPNTVDNKYIIREVWGYEHISQESLPQLINRTRRTLEDNEKTVLVNVPGVGYSLNFEFGEGAESAPKPQLESKQETLSINDIKSGCDQNQKQWRLLFAALLVVTMFNLWNTANALYYKHDYEKVLRAAPYPETKRLDDGTITVTIDNHECTYYKDQLLLQCP